MELDIVEILTNKCEIGSVVFKDITLDVLNLDIPLSVQTCISDTNNIGTLSCPQATFDTLTSTTLTADTMSVEILSSNTINVQTLSADTLDSTSFESSNASCNELNTVTFNCNEVNSRYYESKDFTTLNVEVIQNTTTATVPTRIASTFKNGVLETGATYKVINNTPSLFSDLQLATDSTGTNTLYIYGDVLNTSESLPRIIGYNSTIGTYDNGTAFGGKIAYLSLCSDSSGSPRTLRYERDGKLTLYSNTSTIFWQSTNMVSDIRDKADIRPISSAGGVKCSEKLARLGTYYYNYKEGYGSKERQIGLLAQEVEQEFPEAIISPEGVEEPYLSIDYCRLVPVLIESLKEISRDLTSFQKTLNK